MPDSPSERPYAPPPNAGLVEAVRIDLETLHEHWMAIVFPQVRTGTHAVLGAWRPSSPVTRFAFYLWSTLGGLIVALLYPFTVAGLAIRYYSVRVDRTAARIGLVGVVMVSIVVWGALTVLARYQLSTEGFVAVAAAGGVATVSAALAFIFSRIGGRSTTVALAYPFGVTALFLPPVVAALYSPVVASIVFPRSQLLAIWLLDNVFAVGGLNAWLRARFELVGVAYVGMWFGLAVPAGWFLGLLVTLADLVRPTREESQ